MSACTLIVGVINKSKICFGPNGKLHFHQARDARFPNNPVSPETNCSTCTRATFKTGSATPKTCQRREFYSRAQIRQGADRVSAPTRRASSAPLTLRAELRRSVAIAIAITAPIETVVNYSRRQPLGERRHRGLARRLVVVRRRPFLMLAKGLGPVVATRGVVLRARRGYSLFRLRVKLIGIGLH
jgi:hypothetical protein